ncbi:MAG: efflux RND transporter permease subunit [bacterium]
MIKYLSKRIYLVLILLLILVVAGVYALRQLSVDIFPNLNYPLLNIITHYPGGSPPDIETLVSRPIETQMSGLTNVRRISSTSRQGLSQVAVEFNWGVDVKDARQMVAQALSIVIPSLPQGAIPVIENIGSSLQEIMDFGVTTQNGGMDLGELKYYIRAKVANQLKAVKGISRIEVIGGRDEALVVEPDTLSLLRNELSLSDLRNILLSNNVQEMAGYLEKDYRDYAVRGLGNIEDIQGLKNIVVKNTNGIPILLKGIATVKRGYLPQRYTVHINGQEGVAFCIFKNPNANTIEVAREVYQKLSGIRKTLPPGITIANFYDQSEVINEAARNFRSNILVGGFLVIVVLSLFLGSFRNSLLIAFSIPLSAIVSFLFLRLAHLSLNMITLGAMAVAVGMVVDVSIIVLENILRHRSLGKAPLQAVVEGTKEIMPAGVSGTLTTVAAFIPLLFLSGIGGRFAAPFGWVMIVMLLASLAISLTIIPIWSAREREYKEKKAIAADAVSYFINLNQKILRIFLQRKKRALLIVLGVFLVSAGLLVFSPISFLPQVDEGAILMEYILPPGTSLQESGRIGSLLGRIYMQDPDVQTVYRRTGSEATSYQVEPVNRGELVIRLKPRRLRKRSIFQIIRDLKSITDQIPGLITLYHQVTAEKMDESFSGLPTMFGITLYGEDYDKLLSYSQKIEKLASQTKGIGNVINNAKFTVPEIQVKPNPRQMARYGLSSKEVMDELRIRLGGEIVSWVVKGEKTVPIFLKGKTNGEVRLENLEKMLVKVAHGAYLPLSQLTNISTHYGANSITHINLQREVTLPAEIEGSIGGVSRRLKADIEKLNLPEGYFVEFGGQYKSLLEMLKGFAIFALISVLIVYLIMNVQLGNSVHPLAIMFELPLSFMGAFLAIAAFRQPLNLSFFIGLITLIGVSVNNGIVLIDYVNRRRDSGMEREKAIEEAARIRARPILLTALTSIFALFPISLGLGIGSKIHQPLAICVMGGLLVNTILTLNVLPVIYCVLEDLFKRKRDNSQ